MQKTMNDYYRYLCKAIPIHEACKILGVQRIPSGNDYICRCFFHSDAHPSMHIYIRKVTAIIVFSVEQMEIYFHLLKRSLGAVS